MTTDRTSATPPPDKRWAHDRETPWTIPAGWIGRTQLNLSYGIFIAASILITVVLIAKGQPGNADLPRTAMIGTAFWVAGWIAQAIAHTFLVWALGLSLPSLTLGLIGVETAPRAWSAAKAMLVMLGTTASLVVLAIVFRLIEGGGRIPIFSPDPVDAAGGFWSTPGLGMTSADSMWRAAAWLCSVQAVCQMFPLPRTLGRQTYGAIISLCGRRLDLISQVKLFRRCLIALSITTLVLAIGVLSQESTNRIPRWPLLFGLSVLLWLSSHRPDLGQILRGFHLATESPGTISRQEPFPVSLVGRMRRRQMRKRLRAAIETERTEAVDASRLDDILQRLHTDGAGSLSDEDRKILVRVSEQLRKSRPKNAE